MPNKTNHINSKILNRSTNKIDKIQISSLDLSLKFSSISKIKQAELKRPQKLWTNI